MKRKVICSALAILLCCLSLPLNGYADEPGDASFYVATMECPPEYLEFVEQNISKYVLFEDNDINLSEVSVGQPFTFADPNADIFYFPIMCNGDIYYLLRIYQVEGEFFGVMSDFIADEINSLASMTSAKTPMCLNIEGNKIVATVGAESFCLFEYPETEILSTEDAEMAHADFAYNVKDIKEPLAISINLGQPRDVYEYINLNITERQINDNWCVAYALATVIRTQSNWVASAQALMTRSYGTATPTKTDGFPWENETHYGVVCKGIYSISSAIFGIYPVVTTDRPANMSGILTQEIIEKRPCILAMHNSVGQQGNHAVVLRGWSSAGTWSIWNPWYSGYETFPSDGIYVPMTKSTSTHQYKTFKIAYNFQNIK